jgi:hypothetical protein
MADVFISASVKTGTLKISDFNQTPFTVVTTAPIVDTELLSDRLGSVYLLEAAVPITIDLTLPSNTRLSKSITVTVVGYPDQDPAGNVFVKINDSEYVSYPFPPVAEAQQLKLSEDQVSHLKAGPNRMSVGIRRGRLGFQSVKFDYEASTNGVNINSVVFGHKYKVINFQLNCRTGAGTVNDLNVVLPVGTIVTAYEITYADDGKPWMYLEAGEGSFNFCYVRANSNYLDSAAKVLEKSHMIPEKNRFL